MNYTKGRLSGKIIAILLLAALLVAAFATTAIALKSRSEALNRLNALEKDLAELEKKHDKLLGEKEKLESDTASLAQEKDILEEENRRLSEELAEALDKIGDLSGRLADKPMVYFTFDDGPSSATPIVLDILKEFNIKATFFVIGPESSFKKAMLERMHDEGHLIGVHSYTHAYKTIYSSKDAFFKDFNNVEKMIKDTTGVKPTVFRFPGGSNTGYIKQSVFNSIVPELTKRGYEYIDWNVESGDTGTVYPKSDEVSKRILSQCEYRIKHYKNKSCVVLMHDAAAKKNYIGPTLREIIPKLKNMGYSFETLNEYAPVIKFRKYTLV